MRVLQLLVFSVLSLWPLKAAACDLALVLAVDVSGSVDAQEYRLQMDGLAAGLRDGVVSEALVRARAQVLLLQWSGGSRQEVTLPWTQVQSFADVEALARQVETAPRPWRNFSTAIGEALELALAQFPAVPECKRRVVDVSGDGFSNEGIEPQELREALAAADGRCCATRFEDELPLSAADSSITHDLGGAEGRESVHESDADVDFGGLSVWVPRHDAFAECLEA